MNKQKWDRLRKLILEFSYQEREVTLASGKKSNFYFDGKQTSLHPEGAALIGELMFERIENKFTGIQAVGGPTLGADPLATAIGIISFLKGKPLFAFIVRKEAKGHGTMNWIEGNRHLKPGMKAILVEDVITTGASLLKACQHVKEAGLQPVGVLVLVDREEGGREALEKAGLKVESLFSKSDLLPL